MRAPGWMASSRCACSDSGKRAELAVCRSASASCTGRPWPASWLCAAVQTAGARRCRRMSRQRGTPVAHGAHHRHRQVLGGHTLAAQPAVVDHQHHEPGEVAEHVRGAQQYRGAIARQRDSSLAPANRGRRSSPAPCAVRRARRGPAPRRSASARCRARRAARSSARNSAGSAASTRSANCAAMVSIGSGSASTAAETDGIWRINIESATDPPA